MIDSNSQFFAILTAVGEAKQANATALGTPWTFKEMAVGDANGTDPIPNRAQTKLINEWRRAPVNQVRTDPANPNIIITEQVIPPDVGGRWIREIGLFDADGDLVAVANCAPSFKPLLAQGTGKTQVIRMNFIVANTAQIVLKIDPAVVLATREYVDNAVIEALAKLDFKHSAVVATTANIALSGIQTIDGVLLPADARVLVKNQTQAKDNGLYVVSSTGVWTRAQDADTSLEVTPGLFVSIEKGTVNGDSVWQLVTDGPIALGTTPLAFEMATGRTGVSAGSYANVTVDKYGRVIAGTNPSTLAGHGITDTYTKAEIESIVAQSSSLPVGSMVAFPRASVPPGFLEIDGSVQSIAAYPDLAAYLGTTFNKGDEGAGNFRLPESRGEFLRGWDHGRGINAGRALGSYELDELKSHAHEYPFRLGLATAATGGNATVPSNLIAGSPSTMPPTSASGGTETRPRNLSVMWCIKAWSAPVNQGNIDVAALVKELAALKSAHPVGAIIPFPKAEVPAGYLELNGSVHSIAAYPDLAAYLGTTFNKGDEGAGNFRLPESRGEFLRGWDHGRGVDVGRELGGWQKGSLMAGGDNLSDHSMLFAGLSDPIRRKLTGWDEVYDPELYFPVIKYFSASASDVLVKSEYASHTGVSRPRNLSVMWCIKAWNAPINQGNIDIAALAAQVTNAVPKGYCVGFVMSMNTGAPATAVDVAPGTACGTGNPVFSVATITGVLQAAGSWTAGSGGNKLDTGTRAANSWYHVFLIRRNEGGEADLLFSVSNSAPVVPAGYELVMRLKGRALRTDGAANIAPFINYGNSTDWKILPSDMTLSAVATSSHTVTISVPPGIRVRACFYVSAIGDGPLIYVRSPDANAAVLGVTSGGAYAGGVGLDNTSVLNENFASYCEASTNQSAQVVVQVFAWPNYLVQSARLLTAGWREE